MTEYKNDNFADYYNNLLARDKEDVWYKFRNAFPGRNMEDLLYATYGMSFHDVGCTYYKFADDPRFVSYTHECSWTDKEPDYHRLSFVDESSVYRNTSIYALESLKNKPHMCNVELVDREIQRQKQLDQLYTRKYELEQELNLKQVAERRNVLGSLAESISRLS